MVPHTLASLGTAAQSTRYATNKVKRKFIAPSETVSNYVLGILANILHDVRKKPHLEQCALLTIAFPIRKTMRGLLLRGRRK